MASEVSDVLAAEEFQLWQSGRMEETFFAAEAPPVAGADGRPKKKRKVAVTRALPRHSACVQLRALDKVLRQRTGAGPEQFPGTPEGEVPLLPLRTLVLHTDEASSNLALVCWLAYRSGIRVLFTRDPFH